MPRRITAELSDSSSDELERLRKLTGLSITDVFRYSFTLLRIYVNARLEGKEIRIIDPQDPQLQTRLEIPIELNPEPAKSNPGSKRGTSQSAK